MSALAVQLDFWFCSCCGDLHDGQLEQPVYTFDNGEFQCAFCQFLDGVRSEEAVND